MASRRGPRCRSMRPTPRWKKCCKTRWPSSGWKLVERDGHVGIALANGDERRAVDFDVKDLVPAMRMPAAIAKLLEQFVAPSTWKANGGKGTIEVDGGTLHIDQSLAVRREALIFCERLRAARGLALRSKYPPTLLSDRFALRKACDDAQPIDDVHLPGLDAAGRCRATVARVERPHDSRRLVGVAGHQPRPVVADGVFDARPALERSTRRRPRTAGPRLVGRRWPNASDHQPRCAGTHRAR